MGNGEPKGGMSECTDTKFLSTTTLHNVGTYTNTNRSNVVE